MWPIAPTDSWLPQPDVVWWSEESQKGWRLSWTCIKKDALTRIAVYFVVVAVSRDLTLRRTPSFPCFILQSGLDVGWIAKCN